MKWNWFGWFGLLNLAVFIGLLFITLKPEALAYRIASMSLPFVMLSAIVFPIVASIRASKWWLVASGSGIFMALWFFAKISA